MPEGNINAEVAEHLREHGAHDEDDGQAANKPSRRRIETIEILEAILLAIVAIATALSGYQAALWDGESAKEYATSSRLRSESVEKQPRVQPGRRLQRRHPQRLAAGDRGAATKSSRASSRSASRPSTRRPSRRGSPWTR